MWISKRFRLYKPETFFRRNRYVKEPLICDFEEKGVELNRAKDKLTPQPNDFNPWGDGCPDALRYLQRGRSNKSVANEVLRDGRHERDEVLPILKIQIPESDV